jgi:pimeloyl-ACP methyl ester carboxylesterase
VQGHQGEYFDYFFRAISADPSKITAEARALYTVDHALVPNAGHFTQEEAPQDTWRLAETTRALEPRAR